VLLGCVTFIGEYGRIMDAYSEAAGRAFPSLSAASAGDNGKDGSLDGSCLSDAASCALAPGTAELTEPSDRTDASDTGIAADTADTSDAPVATDSALTADLAVTPCEPLFRDCPDDEILTGCRSYQALIEIAGKAALSPSPMLFCGERGTGKDLLARRVFALSGRQGPFLALDFATAPETLLEGILFGTVEGAFTGAADRPGILELARGGAVYLDGIASMPLGLQDRLLKALESGEATRMGSASKPRPIDVKFMSSCSEPLSGALAAGRLRPGLLARLGVVTLDLPPLREREGDAVLLAERFVASYGAAFGKPAGGISEEVREAFRKHDWPGNVRELKSGIEGAMNALSEGETLLSPVHFSATLLADLFRKKAAPEGTGDGAADAPRQTHYLHSAAEAERIAAALEAAGGNAAKAARSLKISPQLMNYKLKKFSLKKKITVQVG
jgi:arginine utilization regulatory protein